MEILVAIVVLSLVLALPVLALYNLIHAAVSKEGRKRHLASFSIYSVLTIVVFGWAFLSSMSGPRSRHQGQLTGCKSNLKNLAVALEMYSTDFQGHYPPTLSMLTPNYLKIIPNCPSAGADTYSASYQSTPGLEADPDTFTLYCRGKNHEKASVLENSPQYSSNQGLIEHP
ncbi:hypothetical protein DYH09_01210 [bacterium CPR1]|nr:hypothetical protein [bacterium CPR1]